MKEFVTTPGTPRIENYLEAIDTKAVRIQLKAAYEVFKAKLDGMQPPLRLVQDFPQLLDENATGKKVLSADVFAAAADSAEQPPINAEAQQYLFIKNTERVLKKLIDHLEKNPVPLAWEDIGWQRPALEKSLMIPEPEGERFIVFRPKNDGDLLSPLTFLHAYAHFAGEAADDAAAEEAA